MGFVAVHSVNRAVLLQHGVSDAFGPCSLTESSASALRKDSAVCRRPARVTRAA